jgi:integrase
MTTEEAVSAFLKSRTARNLSVSTIRWYRIILEKFASAYPELPDRVEHLEAFLSACPAGDERRHGYYRTLKALYRFIVKRRLAPGDILLFMESPKRVKKEQRPLTADELASLLTYPHEPVIKACLLFLADTGCRLGELHNLAAEDFYIWGHSWVVRIRGKSGHHTVPVTHFCQELLAPFLPFTYNVDWLGRRLSKAFRDAGVPGTAHKLRHTFGTFWEGDISNLQRIFGHSAISTTMIYRHQRMEVMQREQAVNSLIKRIPQQMTLW